MNFEVRPDYTRTLREFLKLNNLVVVYGSWDKNIYYSRDLLSMVEEVEAGSTATTTIEELTKAGVFDREIELIAGDGRIWIFAKDGDKHLTMSNIGVYMDNSVYIKTKGFLR